jgi:mannosyltransferase
MPPEAGDQIAGSSRQAESASWVRWLALFLLLAAGTAARLLFLARKPFWFDECFSVEVARVGWGNFLRLLWWREANMSLYYLLLRIWLGIRAQSGQSEFFIRSLSVLTDAATLLAIYWLARKLYDRRVGLIAAALFACNAYSVRYAQEARSYALFVLLATLSSGLLIVLVREPTRRHRMAYVLVSVLAVYAHFYALLLLAAHWLALRELGSAGLAKDSANSESRGELATQMRRAWIAIGVAVLPLLVFVAKTGAGPIRWIPRPGIGDLLRLCIYVTNGYPVIYLSACLFALLPLKSDLMARTRNWERWRVHFLLLWLLFPVLLTVLLSWARPVFLARYMIFCLPALLILAAAGLSALRPVWLSALIVGVTLILSARAVPFVYEHDFDQERDAAVAAAGFILDHAQPGDAIVFHIAETRIPYEFVRSQRAGENAASRNFTAQLGPEILFPHHGAGLDYRDFTGKPTAEFVRSAVPGHGRVWIMLMNNGPAERPDATTVMLAKTLPESFPRMENWQFTKVEVVLYSKQ